MKPASLILLLLPFICKAQPNCNVFLYNGDTLQYQACKLIEGIDNKYYQFSKEYQETMDEAIRICPYFAYAYREKGAAYIKSGDFITWKKLMDKAVEYAPLEYLSVRASLRYKFFADYKGTLNDIEQLEKITGSDIGPTSNGTYHLNVVKALCYKELGQTNKAIEILKSHIDTGSYIGAFDFLHLGVLYLESKMYNEALIAFQKQKERNPLAEIHYYMAMVFKAKDQSELCRTHLEKAKELYNTGYQMNDPYNQLIDAVYLADIDSELNRACGKLPNQE